MTSTRPYLVRAIYEWITDNGFTPYLLVDCNVAGVEVPESAVENNKIVLNIAHSAAHNLELGDRSISFSARFNGSPMDIFVPLDSVAAIYAKENGRGLVFSEADDSNEGNTERTDESSSLSTKKPTAIKQPNLSVVK